MAMLGMQPRQASACASQRFWGLAMISLWNIAAINDQLKNLSQIEHSRHRSLTGLRVNLVGGLIAYTFQPKKPSLGLWREESGVSMFV